MYQGRNTANTELQTTGKHLGKIHEVYKKKFGDWVDNY
jgi:predicted nucleic-acid-binding Zn-ribbon protein